MADHNPELDMFPDGVEVKEGTVPAFLKLTYVGFTIFGISYWFLYKAGDTALELVQKYNQLTGH